jgi:large subunit ribosomal protein L13
MNKKTYQPKQKEIKRETHILDAKGQILGRFATQIATLLIGKHKPNYSPHMDSGDFVQIKNPDKILVTGKKEDQKIYYSHSGYPGGLKKTAYKDLKERNPSKIISLAVKRMLPQNRLKDQRMARLKFI